MLPEVETTGRDGQQKRKRHRQKSPGSPQEFGELPAAQPDNSEASDDVGADDCLDGEAALFAIKDDRTKRMYIGNRQCRRGRYRKFQQEVDRKQKNPRVPHGMDCAPRQPQAGFREMVGDTA